MRIDPLRPALPPRAAQAWSGGVVPRLHVQRSLARSAAALRALLTVVLALVTLASVVQAGAAFVFCAPMQRTMASCCCPQSGEPEEGPAVERRCCEDRAVPAAERSDAPPEVARAVVGEVVFLGPRRVPPPRRAALLAAHRPSAAFQLHAPARAGPSLRLHVHHGVFLI